MIQEGPHEADRQKDKTLHPALKFEACWRLLEEQIPNPEEFADLEEWLEFALEGHNWNKVLGYHPDEKAKFVLYFRKLKN